MNQEPQSKSSSREVDVEASTKKINELLQTGDRSSALQEAISLRESILGQLPAESTKALAVVDDAISKLRPTGSTATVETRRAFAVGAAGFVLFLLIGFSLGKRSSPQVPITTPAVIIAQATQTPTGTVQGILVYYFNSDYSDRPDVGAKVWLLPGDSAGLVTKDETRHGEEASILDSAAIKTTIANREGRYQLSAIPAGLYTVMIRSSHVSSEDELLGKMYHKVIHQVVPGDSQVVSNNFGSI